MHFGQKTDILLGPGGTISEEVVVHHVASISPFVTVYRLTGLGVVDQRITLLAVSVRARLVAADGL